ncbi:diguanylate cyclase (GGDEF)-like protein [Methylobacterium sp. BE186]|uniref:GGDEF domain-containing protein n=1 Tax=Methylobacterium sp. BE186 TaxID=2817715 RepID=UPI00285952B8|nr:diguanylate cyclase [Methylobacterium sp. BE186]MDR7039799.1 diguanylate cyclase (GGDEF)-like protein [Methylobacterium sp. BE186]
MHALIEAGLNRRWYELRLPEGLEGRYHAEVEAPAGWYLQSWMLIFIAFNLLSLKVDLDAFGADAMAVPAGLTLGVFVPLALGSIALLRGRPSARLQAGTVLVTGLADMAVVLNSARIAPAEHAHTYLILAAIVPLVVGMIAPLSFRHSLAFCGASFALYVTSILSLGLGGTGGSGVPLLVASLILVPLKLAYSREWETKRSFLLGLRERAQSGALAEANARLTILSETDPLTGVANRRLFTERLESAWRDDGPENGWLCLLLVDIDRFKLLNDTAGHAAGDACLVRVAEALRGPVAARGGLIARYGGEEFVSLLPGVGEAEAREIGERMRRAVAGLSIPHPGLGTHGFVTVSVGATAARIADGLEPGALLKAADEALYRAKEGGRDRVETARALPLPGTRASSRSAVAATRLVSVAGRAA